jgi:hypothetical protein
LTLLALAVLATCWYPFVTRHPAVETLPPREPSAAGSAPPS